MAARSRGLGISSKDMHPTPFTSRGSWRRSPRLRCAAAAATLAVPVAKPTLIDVPVSNHGARVRHVIYSKGLDGAFDVVGPAALGGLGSPEYRALNPAGKMPLLLMPDGTALPESEVIVQFILDKWADAGPSLLAPTPELRAVQHLAARLHDVYISPIQACLYRKYDDAAERAALLQSLVAQLDALEGVVVGPYVAGPSLTSGDSALIPTFVFLTFILPRYFGWPDVFAGRPRLAAWWRRVQEDPAASRVIAEVTGGLEGWAAKDRWTELGIVQQIRDNPQLKWVY